MVIFGAGVSQEQFLSASSKSRGFDISYDRIWERLGDRGESKSLPEARVRNWIIQGVHANNILIAPRTSQKFDF